MKERVREGLDMMGLFAQMQQKKAGEQEVLAESILEVPHPLATKEGKFAAFMLMLGLMLLWGAL